MRLTIHTLVHTQLPDVKRGFTREFFLALNPPFPKVKLLRFDGCRSGDIISLELNFFLFRQLWISEVVEEEQSADSWLFVDRGVQLPFFLKSWRHYHQVGKGGKGALITDEIHFTSGTLLTDCIMYPLLLGQFLYRKPIYRKRFCT